MRVDNVEIAYVAGVSYGLYAGPHSAKIKGDFVNLVNEVCVIIVTIPKQEPRCKFFENIFFVKLV